jgi:phage shock protein A
MPITARLSRRFYDKFGDEIVNELVEWLNQVDLAFRSELREVNESNFARADAKMEQRLAELRAEIRGEIGQLRAEIGQFRAEMAELRGQILGVRGDVKGELAALKAELIKWMFLFWAGTALAGLLLK